VEERLVNVSGSLAANTLVEGRRPASAAVTPKAIHWAIHAKEAGADRYMLPDSPADFADWRDERVGWGLILPYRDGLSDKELASADDAPPPIRELRELRGKAPVFRYRLGRDGSGITHIRNYASRKSVPLSGGKIGVGGDAVPFYLLIYATPAEIPWRFQYHLNVSRAVGRLDLKGRTLENYVRALANDWQAADANVTRPVVWAAETGDEVSRLMREAVAERVFEKLKADGDLGRHAQFISGSGATCQNLIAGLRRARPGLIVTTSHGRTDPWRKRREMRANLGRMVDVNKGTLDGKELLSAWEPGGAVWYAHACCSAGSDSSSVYDGMAEDGSEVDQLVKAVARLGAGVSPLPKMLLGAKRPLRCFVGHVEPTFNWTLRQPGTEDDLTVPLIEALYNNLYNWKPVGLAFRQFYQHAADLNSQYDEALEAYRAGVATETLLLYTRLAAWDIKSTVILGDPTVKLNPVPVGKPNSKGAAA
jgi:hypothetical protein